jgi:ribonuclease HI
MKDAPARAPLNRSAIFASLAEDLDIPHVLERFEVTPDRLRELFAEVAGFYRDQEAGCWTLFVDGAARGNPGPAGAGAVLRDPYGIVQGRLSHFLGKATNNVAEYQALLLGLEMARKRGVRNIKIFADSQLMVEQVNGGYQVKSPHLKPLHQAVLKALAGFTAYSLTHLERSQNGEADRLANQAIDQAR